MTTSSSQKTDSDNAVKKIVIRRLPPTLTKEQFLDIVSPLPEYDYFYYCTGDSSLGLNGFSRAYICFKNHQDVFSFRDRFDNYVFLDSKSNEYPALVEYAPYQRRFKLDTKNPPKRDPKCNSIEEDTDYIKYLENFGKPSGDQLPSCEAILEELEQKEKENFGPFAAPKVTTPLLEYLKKKREDKRSGKDRDRDRGDRGNRRRDRDDDKRYNASGYGGKRRDDYYYGSGYKTKDYESSGKSQSSSSKSSTQPKLTLAPKSEFKSEVVSKSSSTSQTQATSSKIEQEKTNNTSKISQAPKENKDDRQSSSTSSSQNKGNYGYRNSGGYGSSNRNNRPKNFDEKPYKEKNPTPSKQQNSEQKQNKEEKPKEQRDKVGVENPDKGVRNKDRPPMQIYNPGQRSNTRQQKN